MIFRLLKEGAVALVPTDTLMGLAVSVMKAAYIHRLFRIKRRPKDKKISVMVHPQFLDDWFVVPEVVWELIPGPYTFLLRPKRKTALPYEKIGVRVPDHRVLLDFIEDIPFPLSATSANISGRRPPERFEDVSTCIRRKADIIVYGQPYLGEPSTVWDPDTGEVIRKGAGYEEVKRYLGV